MNNATAMLIDMQSLTPAEYEQLKNAISKILVENDIEASISRQYNYDSEMGGVVIYQP